MNKSDQYAWAIILAPIIGLTIPCLVTMVIDWIRKR